VKQGGVVSSQNRCVQLTCEGNFSDDLTKEREKNPQDGKEKQIFCVSGRREALQYHNVGCRSPGGEVKAPKEISGGSLLQNHGECQKNCWRGNVKRGTGNLVGGRDRKKHPTKGGRKRGLVEGGGGKTACTGTNREEVTIWTGQLNSRSVQIVPAPSTGLKKERDGDRTVEQGKIIGGDGQGREATGVGQKRLLRGRGQRRSRRRQKKQP